MTVIAFCGTYDDSHEFPVRGNGKSNAMSYYAYGFALEGWEVYANYRITFGKTLTIDQMLDMFYERGSTFHHVVFLVDELSRYFDSHGGNTKEIRRFMGMVKQLRKRWSHLYWSEQRYRDIPKQVRIQTDEVWVPVKTHHDRSPCLEDTCQEPHLIWTFRAKPFSPRYDVVLDAAEVGRMYNTEEIIVDQITIPGKGSTTVG